MPPTNTAPIERSPAPKEPVGPIVGIVIVVLLLLLGALYFWGEKINKQKPQNDLPYTPGIPAENSTS